MMLDLHDYFAETFERGGDLVGQNGRSLSERLARDELVGGLLDDQCYVDGMTQV